MSVSGRVLGVDVGTVRVGLAVSDPRRLVASPRGSLTLSPPAALGDADAQVAADAAERVASVVLQAAVQESCETVVVGLPRALSGGETASTRGARAVADALVRGGLQVVMVDERLTTVQADRTLIAAGRRRARRRDERDAVAAALILQGWLDSRPVTRPS